MELTAREKAILRLKAKVFSDYKIARKLNAYSTNITRSKKNALRNIRQAKNDLEFLRSLVLIGLVTTSLLQIRLRSIHRSIMSGMNIMEPVSF